MAEFTQSEIDHLISCPKEILEAPYRELKLVGADWRNGAKLGALDGTKGAFLVFMRKNDDFPENFSIGLKYNAGDGRGEITLIRCMASMEFTAMDLGTTRSIHTGTFTFTEQARQQSRQG